MKRLIKFLDKIKKSLKEFESYDRVFWNGKLVSCLIIILCFMLIVIITLLVWIF